MRRPPLVTIDWKRGDDAARPDLGDAFTERAADPRGSGDGTRRRGRPVFVVEHHNQQIDRGHERARRVCRRVGRRNRYRDERRTATARAIGECPNDANGERGVGRRLCLEVEHDAAIFALRDDFADALRGE